MSKPRIAVQLYTLHEQMQADPKGTLQRVAEIGYEGVEFAGYGGLSVNEVKEEIDRLGLTAASSHVPLAGLKEDLQNVIDEQKKLGSRYIVVPYLHDNERSEEDYKDLISFLQEASKTCEEHGITLCYHNHDFELTALSDGRLALDAIFEDTNVQTELDIYWLTKANQDPVEWLTRYKDRTPLVHLKDMTTDEEKFFAELGTGGVDIKGVVALADQQEINWFIVEQDKSKRDPFESITMSLDYLKGIL
ncbi:sugar phosphate isomerase/epimerase [Paenalkalicoccus suaedae]|uniref:Sugar phosphate isomerase/epimerase n=1 Tax=Paenalkalicoccus suaedae TaxID=2592382 RepID=A0A859FBW9_9BACI|nr:sugar phosphate isomerase/epimerase [Paenalkalicoccus suaedae]QKS69785.1 sugar phosphate isomerase/epimerase [Paenalkalicoccus suaedae]